MTKSNFKKVSYDVISVTSLPLCQHKPSANVTRLFQFWAPLNQNFWLHHWI